MQRFVVIRCQEEKKMKRKLLIVFVIFGLSLSACKKTAPATTDTDKVFIRIENATAGNFSNFTLNRTQFGAVAVGDTSSYLRFKDVLPFPFANEIAINNTYRYIIEIFPTVYLENGNYLMKVVSDTLPWRYQASFIKE
jgi:hypothetical protein